MSMTQPSPHTPNSPSHRLQRWWEEEQHHWGVMSPQTRCLLLGLSLILFFVDPLLPFAAYMLQRWAAAAWTWRDRWTSVWIWAKQGVWFVTLIVTMALLTSTHIWIIPQLIAAAQTIWQQVLPGTLSLSLFDGHDLMARSLLLLPLAPALALIYERIDARTYVHLRRVLTPADLEPKPKAPDPPQTPEPAPAPVEPTAKRTRTKKQKPRQPHSTPAAQMTIDSFLNHPSPPLPDEKRPQARSPKKKKSKPSPHQMDTASPIVETTAERVPIDWDAVTE